MSATNDNASELRIKVLVQRLKEVELSLYDLEKQRGDFGRLRGFIGLTPEKLTEASKVLFGQIGPGDVPTIIKLKELSEERTRIFRELIQMGKRQQAIEAYCRQMREDRDKSEESELLEIGRDATAEPSEPEQKLHAGKAKQLSDHERKIWEVSQRGCKGRLYVRELDHEDARVPRPWTNEGCPSTYSEAFDDPRWRQRIQDEKSKVRRKALALLEKIVKRGDSRNPHKT